MDNVAYLNAWLNCPDEELRRNYDRQDRISRKRLEYWQNVRDRKVPTHVAVAQYLEFIKSNRKKLKIATESDQAS